MHAYIVTLATAHRQRLRASVVAASSADACGIGRRCAIAAGYAPIALSVRPVRRCHELWRLDYVLRRLRYRYCHPDRGRNQ
jgi:hypothetical protein